jgi:tetratricopeptide (TPR) repeat protein
MNVALSHRLGILCGVTAVLFAAVAASAQEPLAKAKALYDAANYEEALGVLAPVQVPEAQQYKALCMLALGRPQDASGVVEQLITSQPTFEPSAEDVPPRFVALVSDAKKRLLPTIARKAFNEARDQFKSGGREEALKQFDLVVTLASSAGFKDTSEAEDLRTLASGFIELARASRPEPKAPANPAEQPAVAEAPAATIPASAPTPSATQTTAKGTSGAPPARAAVAPPQRTAARTAAPASATATTDVTQPVAVRQTIPPVPSGISGLGSPSASVRVQIGVDGRVVSAAMQQSSHPLYDRLVLQAARDWLYTPAMLNGRPVPSEKVVTIQLR